MHAFNDSEMTDVMTLAETAAYLKLSERTVLNMASRREIPAAKIASQWRFLRSRVLQWLENQMVQPSEPSSPAPVHGLGTLVKPELIFTDIRPGTKQEIIEQLLTPLTERGILSTKNPTLSGLLAREQLASTGIGGGVAIPHLRTRTLAGMKEELIVVGVCPVGTDFKAVDGSMTQVFFLPFTTDDATHLRALTAIAKIAQNGSTVEALSKMRSSEMIYKTIARAALELETEVSNG